MIRESKLKELEGYIEELKVVKMAPIETEGKGFLNFKRYSCNLNNGKTIIRERIIKGGKDGSASVILPITKEGNVLLVVQPRVFSHSTIGVELPAGYIEESEEPEVSAKRELEEETGYTCEELIPLISYYQDDGCSAAFNHAFLALNCSKTSDQQLDSDEFIRYFECSFDEMIELANRGYISGVNSLLAIEKAKSYFRELSLINKENKNTKR